MSLDVLVLGGFVFTDFAVPDLLPLGGKQAMHIHKMPGGDRTIDTMGPDDRDRFFRGIHWGSGAINDALTLDAMRSAGAVLPYSNGAEARMVVISDFIWDVQKFNCIHYSITLTTADNPNGSSGDSGSSADSLANSDLTAAQNSAASNVPLPPSRPAGIGGGVGGGVGGINAGAGSGDTQLSGVGGIGRA